MSKICRAVAFALGAGIVSAPASASNILYTTGAPTGFYFSDIKQGPFDDSYSFTLLSDSDVSVSLSSTPYTAMTLNTFGVFNSANALLTTFTQGQQSSGLSANTDTVLLDPGTYHIGASGTFISQTGYTGVLSVSSVPLPSTIALFGIALLGLGAVGAIKQRSSSTGASVSTS